ncbi:MAG TPA: hypothetical protein VFH15_07510 [Pyrinomonadaceae bacterium]|nr:hypothetical protein [Pyrinomonadaceae bacterium]
MATRVRVLRGVSIRRVVAAQRGATCLASAQVHPARTNLHTFFAYPSLRMFDVRDRSDMSACFARPEYVL